MVFAVLLTNVNYTNLRATVHRSLDFNSGYSWFPVIGPAHGACAKELRGKCVGGPIYFLCKNKNFKTTNLAIVTYVIRQIRIVIIVINDCVKSR